MGTRSASEMQSHGECFAAIAIKRADCFSRHPIGTFSNAADGGA